MKEGTEMELPLAGVKVLDLTAIVLGPLATLCLADLGAEVIKVESPAGDGIRNSGTVPVPGMSSIYLALNRNKKSLALDLKMPEASEILQRLTRWADVVVHNMRPASARSLGINYESLLKQNPKLIYCSASGFAAGTDRADDPAVDDVIQAASGLADLFSKAGHGPIYAPTILADKICGLVMCQAILAGLIGRERTGKGVAINIPMAETMKAFLAYEHMGAATFANANGTTGYSRLTTPHRKPIPTRDGYIAMTPYTKRDWQRFFRAAGHPELAESPRVTDATLRNAEIGFLYAQLAEVLRERDTSEWIEIARGVDIPVASVQSLDDAITDPMLEALGFIVRYDHPDVGPIRGPGPLIKRHDNFEIKVESAPRLGQDTVQILRTAGYNDNEISSFINSSVVFDA
jgi:crotonobetainyl-CoA:carnitine CoA-transferase CaiB-like acyl-CoA transferase